MKNLLLRILTITFLLITGCSSVEVNILGITQKSFNNAPGNKNIVYEEITPGIFESRYSNGGRIYGKVVSESDSSLGNSLISFAFIENDKTDNWIFFKTDKYGKFSITNLKPGIYKVSSLKPEYYLNVINDIDMVNNNEKELIFILKK